MLSSMQRIFLPSSSASPADSRLLQHTRERTIIETRCIWRGNMLVDRRNSDPSRKRNSRRCGRTPLVHANRERTSANVVSNGHGIFLHGSMSAEVVPEGVLRAFIRVYPDLFATNDLTHLGLIADSEFGWPIGTSRTNV